MICKRWLEVSAVDLKAGVCWTAAGQALTLLCVGLKFVAYLGFPCFQKLRRGRDETRLLKLQPRTLISLGVISVTERQC